MADKPITFSDMFQDQFLKGADFNGQPYVVRISGVKLEELDGIKGKRIAGILSFEGKSRGLPLNKTNAIAIRGMFGPIATEWIGKRIQLHTVKVTVDGEEHDAIRVQGSPDIAATIEFSCRLGRKNGVKFKLWKTAEPGSKKPANGKPAAKPVPISAPVTTDGEPPPDDSGEGYEPGADLDEAVS